MEEWLIGEGLLNLEVKENPADGAQPAQENMSFRLCPIDGAVVYDEGFQRTA